MIRITRTKTFNTETAKLIGEVAHGAYGDPLGYEEKLYLTPEGDYFLYANGGAYSKYPKEKILSYTRARAEKWQKENL